MVYATPFDPETRQCTTASVKTGFKSLEEVPPAAGEPVAQYQAMVIYPGVIFTRFPWRTECDSRR